MISNELKNQIKEKIKKNSSSLNENIFSILDIEGRELYHSKILAYLLAPNGKYHSGNDEENTVNVSHKCGSRLLKNFLNTMDISVGRNNLDNAEVFIEYQADEESRFDILIKINKFWIVIENKIYADDQKKQLKRYYTFLKNKEKQKEISKFKLIYLTINGREPSKESRMDLEETDYLSLSYDDIRTWLGKCNYKSIKPVLDNYKLCLDNLLFEKDIADLIIYKEEWDIASSDFDSEEEKNIISNVLENHIYPYLINSIIVNSKFFTDQEENLDYYETTLYIWVSYGKYGKHKVNYYHYFEFKDGKLYLLPIVIDEIILPDYEKWYIPTERQSGWRNTWNKRYEISYNCSITEFITALTNSNTGEIEKRLEVQLKFINSNKSH